MNLPEKFLSVLLLTISLCVSGTESELLSNGDFETGVPDGFILNNASIMKEGGSNGPKVLKLSGKNSSVVVENLALNLNQRYKLSYQVKAGDKVLTGNGYQGFRVYVSWGGLDNRTQKTGYEWQDSFPDAYQSKSLIFTTPAIPKKIIITCELNDAGTLYLDNFKLEALPPEKLPDVKISISKPFFKNIIYSSDPVSEITGSVSANENVSSAELKFSEKDFGKVLFEKKFSNIKDKFDFSIPAEKLEYGKYILSVTALAKDGKILEEAETPIWKLEKYSEEVVIKNDLNFYIDNQIFYPVPFMDIGVICKNGSLEDFRMAFYHARKNGVNTFMVHCKTRTVLLNMFKAAEEFDCKIILTSEYPEAETKEKQEQWKKRALEKIMLPEIIHSKALLAYIPKDEPMWCGIPIQNIQAAHDVLKEKDPYHPIWIIEAPRGKLKDLTEYSRLTDIWGCDIYPVPAPNTHSDLNDKGLTSTGKYTQIFKESVHGCKPVCMTLQAFSWGTYLGKDPQIYPTASELDFMTFDCIVNGADIIGFWGIYCINKEEFYEVLFGTTRKLAALSGITTLPQANNKTITCNNPAIKFLTKEKNGNIYMIAVNETDKEQQAGFNGRFGVSVLNAIFENREIPCLDGFTDKFAAYGYHIYATGSLPEPIVKTIPVNEEMEKRGSPFIKNAILNQNEYKGNAKWIWFPGKSNTPFSKTAFKKEFTLDEIPENAEIIITADDSYFLFVNEIKVGEDNSFSIAESYNIKPFLKKGTNTIYIEASDAGSAPCGLLADISLIDLKGNRYNIPSDHSWQTKEIKNLSLMSPPEFQGVNAAQVADYGQGPWFIIHIREVK